MYHTVLVALDGSHNADLVLQEALKFSAAGAQITAVTVVDNPLINYGNDSPYFTDFNFNAAHAEFVQEAEMILENAATDSQRLAGITIKTQLIDLGMHAGGEIATAIEAAAESAKADLLVIGTHGRHGVKHFFLGSVAEQVIRRIHIPVLLVRDHSNDVPK
jgi:nucleotide-binding universal stress UspA family protein